MDVPSTEEHISRGPRPRRGRIIRIAMLGLLVVGLGLMAPVALVEIDDTAVPRLEQLDIDVDVDPAAYGTSLVCGSGGCSLQIDIRGGESAALLWERLEALEGSCQTVGGLDLRQVCVDSLSEPSGNVFFLSFKRHLEL